MEWELDVQPIGIVRSCFPCKNGTPRQPTIASNARGQLKISKGIYNNPEHALEGLQEFSHVWLIFVFHKNKSGKFVKAKVSPPRLNGGKMGVFATRSPYRLNPIGLSLVKLESVEGDTLHFSGHDLVDGTPVLDIKPYIREYDSPPSDRLLATRASASALPAGHVTQSRTDQQEGLVDSANPTETPRSPRVDDGSRLCEARREPLPRADDVDRLCEGPNTVTVVPHGEGQSRSRSDPQPATNRSGARSPDPSAPPPIISDHYQQTTADTPLSDRHAASPAPTGDSAVCPAPSSARERSAGDSAVCPASSSAGERSAGDSAACPAPSSAGESGDTWLSRLRPERWTVSFTAWAESQLQRFSAAAEAGAYRLSWLRDAAELRGALEELLTADPRSVYRRAQNDQLLYHLALDASHVTCWFDPARRVVEVLRLQPLADSPLAEVTGKTAANDDVETSTVGESSGD